MPAEKTLVKNTRSTKSTATKTKHKLRYTKKIVLAALIKANGVKVRAAELLECTRPTLDEYLKRWPDLQREFDGIIEGRIDAIGDTVLRAAVEGNLSAAMFVLRTQGKNAGWTEGRAANVNEVRSSTAKSIFQKLRDGEISATNAALEFEMEGLPVPESVRLIMQKETPEQPDPTGGAYSPVSEEEMAERVKERVANVEQQITDLPEREDEVQNMKTILAPTTDAFNPVNNVE